MLIIIAGGKEIIETMASNQFALNIKKQEKTIINRLGNINGIPSIKISEIAEASLVTRDISPPVFLPVKKETDKYKETGKCPICGADIYLEESGWTGHY